MPRAINKGTCIQQGDLFYSAGQHRKKLGEVLEKNAGEWTGRVEISGEEIPGSKRSMYGYILTYSKLKGERLSSALSTDETLISSSVAPHCGNVV